MAMLVLTVEVVRADDTDWDAISTHLKQHWVPSLPPLPQNPMDQSAYEPIAALGAFQSESSAC